MWNIEYTDEFDAWLAQLTQVEQDAVYESVGLLEAKGPNLRRPYVGVIKNSRHHNMKELITQVHGSPLRTFFIFDPKRTGILLIGGDKTGDKLFYDRMIPIVDRLYETYLIETKQE